MTTIEELKKKAESFPVGTDVIYEIEGMKEDNGFPFKYVIQNNIF